MPADEIDPDELAILSQLGRMHRMAAEGIPLPDILARVMAPETATNYAERNRLAMEALEKRILDPAYLARFAAIQAIEDPGARSAAAATFKRENFAAIDMEAVHRQIAARNRQMVAEGMLPPDAPV